LSAHVSILIHTRMDTLTQKHRFKKKSAEALASLPYCKNHRSAKKLPLNHCTVDFSAACRKQELAIHSEYICNRYSRALDIHTQKTLHTKQQRREHESSDENVNVDQVPSNVRVRGESVCS